MLIVAVHGDNALAIGPVFQEPGKGGFQGCALAAIDLVMEQMNFFMGVRRTLKTGQIFGLGAVVDQNDIGKTVFQQAIDHGVQLFIRVKGWKDHGNFG